MFKITLSLLFVFVVSSLASEDSYIFEAKGEFAKELKLLVEKYSKDDKINVKVLKSSDIKENGGIISAFLSSDNGIGNTDAGKKIYNNNCFKCHGINASESFYPNARILNTLTKNEIIDQVQNYKRSPIYGGSTHFVMRNAVEIMNDNDIQSVAEYIVNSNNKEVTTEKSNENNSVDEKLSTSSSYLK